MKFGEKLKRLLGGESQRSVAKTMGINESVLRVYIKNGKHPAYFNAVKIAQSLGVDVGWMLDDSKGFPPSQTSVKQAKPQAEGSGKRRAVIVAAAGILKGETLNKLYGVAVELLAKNAGNEGEQ